MFPQLGTFCKIADQCPLQMFKFKIAKERLRKSFKLKETKET